MRFRRFGWGWQGRRQEEWAALPIAPAAAPGGRATTDAKPISGNIVAAGDQRPRDAGASAAPAEGQPASLARAMQAERPVSANNHTWNFMSLIAAKSCTPPPTRFVV